jgi:DNA-binding transcriptional regulator GbsR (MarR family)
MPSQIQQEFILHFGEMGSRWGINRTVGQIYALLFLSETPLCADDIVAALHVSRSNVSMSLKELQSWNLVRLRHIPDDRRDHFTTPEDLWEIVRILIAERKKREIDPTLTKLRELELAAPEGADTYALRRMSELRELIETMTAFYDEMNRLETEKLVALLKTRSQAAQGDRFDGFRRIPRDRQEEEGLTPWTRSFSRASSSARTSRSTSCSRRSPSRSAGCSCSSSCASTHTGEDRWMDLYRFWVKVFALSFAMGVVSGITMSFQFGTNWPGFMEAVGNVAGPLLAYEVLTAFFLEAAFLGIMLFGWRRVPESWLHTTATVLVAFGTTLSAFWILVLNSWMHTPAGYECATAWSSRPTGGRSSSTPRCPIGSRTCCSPRA